MRLLARCVLVMVVLIGPMWAVGALGTAWTGVTDSDISEILEDEPGWDCATMGNRVCGAP